MNEWRRLLSSGSRVSLPPLSADAVKMRYFFLQDWGKTLELNRCSRMITIKASVSVLSVTLGDVMVQRKSAEVAPCFIGFALFVAQLLRESI